MNGKPQRLKSPNCHYHNRLESVVDIQEQGPAQDYTNFHVAQV